MSSLWVDVNELGSTYAESQYAYDAVKQLPTYFGACLEENTLE